MIEKMKAHPAPVYKVKMRSTEDVDLLRALRLHTHKPFRIDANEAFQFEEIRNLLPELEQLGVHLIEQPLAKTEWDAMKELKALSKIPLYADESCVTEKDVAMCAGAFHGINIKLTKCGGITPALRMIGEARRLGLKVMMGSMNESTIGSAAVAHLLPLLDEVDMDGTLLLNEDVGQGLKIEEGIVTIPQAPGLGVHFWGEKRKK
jgi:L-alanine-DL-glutamate epimerase-like enolase superfamily enzyme